VIQKQLIDKLAIAILEGTFREGDTVRADASGGELVLEKAQAAVAAA
jgi:ATP-dependent Clp protease ATP-binding subunit ClpB